MWFCVIRYNLYINNMIITRFAPSPTGDPHIGNIRTALFAYLFARSQKGKFLFRIEDTDRDRYVENSIDTIKEAMEWLGIVSDNYDKPMIQSERLEIYKKAALQLVEQGDAYICTCSKERLEEVRASQRENKQPPRYDGHCRNKNIKELSEGAVIRMKIPREGKSSIEDLVRGHVEFDYSTLDDQVILKSDGFPTYHLASVVDDHEMEITHVLRAEEWLSSTPKHILLYEMLGWRDATPHYAHLPVILSPTHGKLSKRDGAVGIMEYKKMGYLPEALINFMVLLGWSPKTDEEFFTLDQLEERFKIGQVNKAGAVFDINKLDNFNRHYLVELLAKDKKRLLSLIDRESVDLMDDLDRTLGTGQTIKQVLLDLIIPRINKLDEFQNHLKTFVEQPKIEVDKIIFRKSNKDNTRLALTMFSDNSENIKEEDWLWNNIKKVMEDVVTGNNLTNGDVFWPIRYALTGEEKSPPPEEIATILGKSETISRIKQAISLLDKN